MHQKMAVLEKTKTIQILSAKRNEDYKYQRLANYLMIMTFLKSKDHINDQNENNVSHTNLFIQKKKIAGSYA